MHTPPNIAGASSPFGRAMQFLGRSGFEFPNRIADPAPTREKLAPRYKLIAGLMLAVLIPRVIMALLIPTLCADGTVYVTAAEQIERDGISCPTRYCLNLYPIILSTLHQLGFSWEIAGKTWGLFCSVLVVWPLFGWIRRQFDDHVATLACLLYAGHPKLIEWSPEVIREQTFWLLFMTALYACWRAATEVRFGYYFIAAITMAAATFTRFEGLFLFIPLVGWTAARLVALRTARGRLAAIFFLTFLAAPCVLLAVQFLWMRKTPITDFLNSAPLARVEGLLRSFLGIQQETVVAFDRDQFGVRPGPFSLTTLGKTFQVILRGLTPPYGVLLLIGLVSQTRRSLRADRLPAVFVALITVAAIWIHTWYSGLASSRYILTVAIFSSGTAAIGLLDACRAISLLTSELNVASWRRVAAAALTASAFIYGCCDAFKTSYAGRVDKAALGAWIRTHYGSDKLIYGCDEQLDLIAYYAGCECHRVPVNRDPKIIPIEVRYLKPDFVLLSNPPLPPASCRAMTDSAAELGMTKLEVPTTAVRRPIVMSKLDDLQTVRSDSAGALRR